MSHIVLTDKVDPRHMDQRIPDWFKRKLHQEDPILYITWNKIRERWVLNQCVQHCPDAPTNWHCHRCRLDPFWMCQEEDGSYMEISDRIIEKARAMNIDRRFGGVEGLIKAMDENDRKKEEQHRKDVKSHIEGHKKDEKRNLQRAIDLMERHDWMRPNK